MSNFILKPSLQALFKNPPPFPVWWNTALYKVSPRRLKPWHTPISLVVYLTKRCNFKCEFCFTYDDLNKADWKNFELNVEGFKRILDSEFGKRSLRVGLLGGEPFLNPFIFDFLELAHARGKVTTVVTNASIINENHFKKLLNHAPTMLGVSLYENNVAAVAKISEWMAFHKKDFWVQSVISASQIEKIPEVIQFASENGIQNLILSNYNPVSTGQLDQVIFDDNLFFKEQGRIALDLARQKKINLVLPQPVAREAGPRNCQMAFSYVHVDSKGTMGACCFRPPHSKFGNIFQPESWNNEANLKLRETFLDSSKTPLKECLHCENFNRDLYGL